MQYEKPTSYLIKLSSNATLRVWFSHKYCKKLQEDEVDVRKLKKKDVAMALAGFREALRDLGALEKKNDIS
jgi:hypothetical protein